MIRLLNPILRNPDEYGFAAFGKVVSGMELVKKIQHLPDEGQYPLDPVKIISIQRVD